MTHCDEEGVLEANDRKVVCRVAEEQRSSSEGLGTYTGDSSDGSSPVGPFKYLQKRESTVVLREFLLGLNLLVHHLVLVILAGSAVVYDRQTHHVVVWCSPIQLDHTLLGLFLIALVDVIDVRFRDERQHEHEKLGMHQR